MNRIPIFTSYRERVSTYSALFLILSIHLLLIYKDYREFVSKPFLYTTAKVLNSHLKVKSGRSYQVLKLKLRDGKVVYTSTTKKDNFQNSLIRVKLFPSMNSKSGEKLGFVEYMRGFYIRSRVLESLGKDGSFQSKLKDMIESQHKNRDLASLFSAIFLATPIDKGVRERMTLFGINHLVALSGFHLGILSSTIFLIILPLYKPLQRRFFPWRSREFDVALLTLVTLFGYLYLVDFPPSLLRSYAMMFFAFLALFFWLELISFEFLSIVVVSLLTLSPTLSVSLAFWLSVAGVFYIFLFLKYLRNRVLVALTLPFAIHILMIPIAHSIFDEVSIYQWLSPILSWIFIPLYPISLIAHTFGAGDIFDNYILYLWRVPLEFEYKTLPEYTLFIYLILTLLATRYRVALFGVVTLSIASAIYLYLI